MPKFYFTGLGDGSSWESLGNWNTALDGSGDSPTNIPWTDDGDGGAWYSDYDLGEGGYVATVNTGTIIDPNHAVTGEFTLGLVNYGTISGGNFPSHPDAYLYNNFNNNGTINGGVFGPYFNNIGTIDDGEFPGDNVNNGTSYGGAGIINGGTFSGNSFTNYNSSYIDGGTFSGASLTNNSGAIINGGTFSASVANQAQESYIAGGTFTGSVGNSGYISGGEFSGSVTNDNSIGGGLFSGSVGNNYSISGGTFSGSITNYGSVSGIIFSGNGFSNALGAQVFDSDLTDGSGFSHAALGNLYFGYTGTTQHGGNDYAIVGSWIYTTYPQSGGAGGGIDIARLLGLPFFVKI